MDTKVIWTGKKKTDTFTGVPHMKYFFKDNVFDVKISKVWPHSRDWYFEIKALDLQRPVASSFELIKDLTPIMTLREAKAICEHIIYGFQKMNNEHNVDKAHYFQLIYGQLYKK